MIKSVCIFCGSSSSEEKKTSFNKEHGKIAGIHNGSTEYAKKMISLGYQFVTISSDYRAMSTYAQSIVKEMKEMKEIKETTTY